jgi:hypothetical protein
VAGDLLGTVGQLVTGGDTALAGDLLGTVEQVLAGGGAGALDNLLGTAGQVLSGGGSGALDSLLGTVTQLIGAGSGVSLDGLLATVGQLAGDGDLGSLDDLLATVQSLLGGDLATDLLGGLLGTVDGVLAPVIGSTGGLLGTADLLTGIVYGPGGQPIGSITPGTTTFRDRNGRILGFVLVPPTSPSGSATRPSESLSFSVRATRRQRISRVKRRGIALTTRCSTACNVVTVATIDRRTARRLRLGRRTVTIGSAAAGRGGRISLRVSRKALTKLSRTVAPRRRGSRRQTVKVLVKAIAYDRRGRRSAVRRVSVRITR